MPVALVLATVLWQRVHWWRHREERDRERVAEFFADAENWSPAIQDPPPQRVMNLCQKLKLETLFLSAMDSLRNTVWAQFNQWTSIILGKDLRRTMEAAARAQGKPPVGGDSEPADGDTKGGSEVA